MNNFDIHPELREHLLERLGHRAERLSKVAQLDAPVNVIALMTEHVITTAMLVCGDELAHALFRKAMGAIRERDGICSLCGERPLVPATKVCVVCEAEMMAMDEELDKL